MSKLKYNDGTGFKQIAPSMDEFDDLEGTIATHMANIANEQGRHGIRYWEEKLGIEVDGEWIEFKGGGGSTVPLGNVVDFTATGDDGKVTLSWKDPEDIVVEGIVISQWKGTKVLRKTGSYPANENDGVLVVDSGVRNQYEINGFEDIGLVNDTEYFYMAFPYTVDGMYTSNIVNRVSTTPTTQKIYGVEIDEGNSNPETSVAYIDDAIGFTPMTGNDGSHQWGSWQSIFDDLGIKPVMLKNGVEQYDINPNDYTKKVDGTNADITSGNDGDVMIKFPRIYWKINRVGTKLQVRFSTETFDGAICNAHTVGNIEKDSIYISAYKGSNLSNKLRSLSGKTPYVGGTAPAGTIGTCRTMAQANGNGYQQMSYYPLLMLQVLYLVFFKNLDSQTALGRGYVDGNTSAINTGGANTKGMFYGETTGKLQNKFCGIEDFYGNVFYWIDGIYSDEQWNILLSKQDVFNDTGAGYVNQGQGATANLSGYINLVQGGNETGFIVKEKDGSATTYYSDNGNLYAGQLANFGGDWRNAANAGAFQLYLIRTASYSGAASGAALCFIGN